MTAIHRSKEPPMTTTPTAIDPAELPDVITAYLRAHHARHRAPAIAASRPDATVTDEGPTYHGHAEIRAWLSRSASEFTYTIEMTGATKIDDDHYDVTHHPAGEFP